MLASYQVPASLSRVADASLEIRIKKPEHLFPGIVHKLPVAVGRAEGFERVKEFYMFDSGVKPLMLGAFKLCLFFLFAISFLMAPKKREYFSFALFALFSALAAVSYSRYVPVYFDYYFRNALTFLANTFAFCAIPWVAADILRLSDRPRSLARTYGGGIALVFLGATLLVANRVNEISLYQLAGRWILS